MKRPVITYIVTYGSPGVSSQSTAHGVRALGELIAYLVESGRQIKSVEQKKP